MQSAMIEPASSCQQREGQRAGRAELAAAERRFGFTLQLQLTLCSFSRRSLVASAGLGTYAEVFAGSVQLDEEGEPRPCAIKRLSVEKGLRAERLLQEALTMIKCQDEEQPLLLAMALGDGDYYLVSRAQRQL